MYTLLSKQVCLNYLKPNLNAKCFSVIHIFPKIILLNYVTQYDRSISHSTRLMTFEQVYYPHQNAITNVTHLIIVKYKDVSQNFSWDFKTLNP